jgi:hypothetical protein
MLLWKSERQDVHSARTFKDDEERCKASVRNDSVKCFSFAFVLSSSSSRLAIDESMNIEAHLEPLRIYLLFLFDCSESCTILLVSCRGLSVSEGLNIDGHFKPRLMNRLFSLLFDDCDGL